MSIMRSKLFIALCVIVPVVLVVLVVIDWFVYPFVSLKPNYADVEATFNKLQIPSDWKLVSEGSNKGIAGRQCPIESDGCFSKTTNYSTPSSVMREDVEQVVLSSGCVSAAVRDETQKGDPREVFEYSCMAAGIRVVGTWTKNGGTVSAGVSASSR